MERRSNTTLTLCKNFHSHICHNYGRKIMKVEHVAYGISYFIIAFSEYHWPYYLIGSVVVTSLLFGAE